ncbi:hypothetical protein BHE74_00033519 [Ensete ventricosum]|nr:hypothetical protein BHE74_00033519 [Ensete ventricosum]
MFQRLIFLHEKCCRMHQSVLPACPWKEKHRLFRIIKDYLPSFCLFLFVDFAHGSHQCPIDSRSWNLGSLFLDEPFLIS